MLIKRKKKLQDKTPHTLVSRISVQARISVQVEILTKMNKRTGLNKRKGRDLAQSTKISAG